MQVIIKNNTKRIAILKDKSILAGSYKVIRNDKETNKTYSKDGLSLSSAYAIYNGLLKN
ncbi:MAG: hypothetical protein GY823_14245 [Flavobacteriaceae bacterium]|nr:hypothetical protein [Flavobacteriaceae bacterium]